MHMCTNRNVIIVCCTLTCAQHVTLNYCSVLALDRARYLRNIELKPEVTAICIIREN